MNHLNKIYQRLFKTFGPQGWWPVKSSDSESRILEVCLGAILTQNTNWKNVEKALANLRKNKLFSLKKLDKLPSKKLEKLIRSSGYYRQKAKKIKIFIAHVINLGGFKKFFARKNLREELLSIYGIGPETADSIILYAAKKPVFVVDLYTKRFLQRFGLSSKQLNYSEAQELFHSYLPRDEKLFKEYHALLVELSKKHCTKKNPSCKSCPLFDSCKKHL